MGERKVIRVRGAGNVVSSGSATATVVSSGTAIVPVPGQPGAIQTVVIPQLALM